MSRATLDVDIVSDVICPWCFIGMVRMEQALAKVEVDARVTLHPFQLDPSLPPEGVDLRERLEEKYGVSSERMFDRVEQAARESGIPLDFKRVSRTPNTLRAHVLLEAAQPRGTQRELARALFEAYFLEGRDIGDVNVLASVAAKHGIPEDEAIALASDPKAREETAKAAYDYAEQGIGGVPFFILDQKFAISGAQSVDTFVSVIERVLSKR